MADQEACSRIEQRSVIKFLVSEECKPVEIHRRMSTVYGATCFSRKNVYKWAKLFKEGRSSVEDEDRPGRPTEVREAYRSEGGLQKCAQMGKRLRDHKTVKQEGYDFNDANVETSLPTLKMLRDHMAIEGEDYVIYDRNVTTQRPFLKNQYQVRMQEHLTRPFIVQKHQLYTRTFKRPRTLRNNLKSTCDKEAFRARGHNKKRIVFYNMPNWWSTGANFRGCECSYCEIEYSQNISHADLVLFDGVRLSSRHPPPRPWGQIWVVLGNEAPIYYTGMLHTPQWKGVFNWTSTHRVDSDIFHPYSLLLDRNGSLRTRTYYESMAKSKKKLAIALISHCDTISLREDYIKELRLYMKIDVYGRCGIKTACPKGNATCVRELMQSYTFLLAFENSLCEDYVTEKFFQTFHDDFTVIPVVRGGTKYHRYFPNDTFIDAGDFSSPKDLAKYLIKISKDTKKVADMLEAKSRYQPIGLSRQCHLCYLLHNFNISTSGLDPNVPAADRAYLTKTYPDAFLWLLKDKCFRPSDFTGAPTTIINMKKFKYV